MKATHTAVQIVLDGGVESVESGGGFRRRKEVNMIKICGPQFVEKHVRMRGKVAV